jgi:hypothetical protein
LAYLAAARAADPGTRPLYPFCPRPAAVISPQAPKSVRTYRFVKT